MVPAIELSILVDDVVWQCDLLEESSHAETKADERKTQRTV